MNLLRNLARSGLGTLMLAGAVTTANADIRTCAANSANQRIAETYEQRFAATLNQPATNAIADLYAESAVLMPPSDETLVGRQPIADYLRASHVPAQHQGYTIDLVSCEMIGGALHVAAVWGMPTHSDTGTGWASGNVMRVLQPGADGQWLSAYEIWN